MKKLTIDIAEKMLYKTEIQVRANDVNYAGHLGNVQIIGILDEVRVRFFDWMGYKESDVEGCSSIMGDISCRFLGEAFWGETLIVEVGIGDFMEKAYRVFFKIQKKDNKPIAEAATTLVTFNYKTRSVEKVPSRFKEKVEALKKNELPDK